MTSGNSHSGFQQLNNSGSQNINFYGAGDYSDPMSRLFLTDPTVGRSNLSVEKGDRVSGTCEWILHDPQYLVWVASTSSSLWLSGGPGKGKTMIAMHVTEVLQRRVQASESDTAIFFSAATSILNKTPLLQSFED